MNVVIVLINMMFCGISFKSQYRIFRILYIGLRVIFIINISTGAILLFLRCG